MPEIPRTTRRLTNGSLPPRKRRQSNAVRPHHRPVTRVVIGSAKTGSDDAPAPAKNEEFVVEVQPQIHGLVDIYRDAELGGCAKVYVTDSHAHTKKLNYLSNEEVEKAAGDLCDRDTQHKDNKPFARIVASGKNEAGLSITCFSNNTPEDHALDSDSGHIQEMADFSEDDTVLSDVSVTDSNVYAGGSHTLLFLDNHNSHGSFATEYSTVQPREHPQLLLANASAWDSSMAKDTPGSSRGDTSGTARAVSTNNTPSKKPQAARVLGRQNSVSEMNSERESHLGAAASDPVGASGSSSRSVAPTTGASTAAAPITSAPTTGVSTTGASTTGASTTGAPTTSDSTIGTSTTGAPTTGAPTADAHASNAINTGASITANSSSGAPTSSASASSTSTSGPSTLEKSAPGPSTPVAPTSGSLTSGPSASAAITSAGTPPVPITLNAPEGKAENVNTANTEAPASTLRNQAATEVRIASQTTPAVNGQSTPFSSKCHRHENCNEWPSCLTRSKQMTRAARKELEGLQVSFDHIIKTPLPERRTARKNYYIQEQPRARNRALSRSRSDDQPKAGAAVVSTPARTPQSKPSGNARMTEKDDVSDDENLAYCDVCKRRISSRISLAEHMITHEAVSFHDTPTFYDCSYCKTRVFSQDNLDRHMKKHRLSRRYECKHCSETRTSRRSMDDHVRRVHTFEKPHACRVCNESFYSSRDKWRHEKRHLELQDESDYSRVTPDADRSRSLAVEKSYKCEICDQSFSSSREKWRHQKRHTEVADGGEQIFEASHDQNPDDSRSEKDPETFSCPFCSSAFTEKWIYVQHLKSHGMKYDRSTRSSH